MCSYKHKINEAKSVMIPTSLANIENDESCDREQEKNSDVNVEAYLSEEGISTLKIDLVVSKCQCNR